jgi:hypothetical protein
MISAIRFASNQPQKAQQPAPQPAAPPEAQPSATPTPETPAGESAGLPVGDFKKKEFKGVCPFKSAVSAKDPKVAQDEAEAAKKAEQERQARATERRSGCGGW